MVIFDNAVRILTKVVFFIFLYSGDEISLFTDGKTLGGQSLGACAGQVVSGGQWLTVFVSNLLLILSVFK